MKLVQISDTHIDEPGTLVYGHFDTTRALEATVKVINAMDPGPDLVLHTGDIASHGSVPRYEAFKTITDELTAPLALIPGNHDDRDALRSVFGRCPPRVISCSSYLKTTLCGSFVATALLPAIRRARCVPSVWLGWMRAWARRRPGPQLSPCTIRRFIPA